MPVSTKLDCVIVGYNEIDFKRVLKAQESAEKYSGGYRNLKANSLIYNGERINYTMLLNKLIGEATRRDVDLNVFRLPNLAVCYLKNYLSRYHFNVEIVNFFNSEKERFAQLLDHSPNAVAITTTYYVDYEPVKEIVEFIKSKNQQTKIIVGGPHIFNICTEYDITTQDYLFEEIGADIYVFDAQGEQTLGRVLEQLRESGRADPSRVPNLIYTDSGPEFRRTERVIENNDMDENIIDWSRFDPDFITPTVSMRTARSCAYKCSFCSFPLMAGPLNLTRLEMIETEMAHLKEAGVMNLIFIDDTFNVPLPRFKDICRMMIKKRFGFNWYSMFRCSNSDEESFDLMQESGCKGVFLGIESGSQAMLDKMNKVVKVEKYFRGIEQLKQRGITTLASFIVGFPGETSHTVNETISFIEQTAPTFYRAQLYYHDVKVPVHKQAKDYGLTGAGYSWTHDSMSWQEACDWVETIYKSIKSSTIFPVFGFDLESIAYLVGEGISLDEIKRFAELAQDMLLRSLDHSQGDFGIQERELKSLFQSHAFQSGG